MRIFYNLLVLLLFCSWSKAQTVVDVIVNSEDHNTLEAAVVEAGLVETLNGEGPFTVFAPTDSAFSALPEGLIDTLLADPTGDLTDILLYHVISGDIRSTDLMDGQMVATINGKDVTITINDAGAFVNDAQITVVDIATDNGVVHVIDAVLVPPTTTVVDVIINSEDHNTLEAAVVEAGLVETLNGEGPFTVFAPTDSAFSALPEGLIDTLLADPTGDLTGILLYHVISGDIRSTDLMDGQMVATINGKDVTITINDAGAFVNDAQITVVDIATDNGVVHVIDAVLVPPTTTVVDVIINSEDHNTLETAVAAAGLVETLNGEGPFTVFAPTDSAFSALPEGLIDTLLADPTGDLTDILLYHVISGDIRSTDLMDGQMVATINGKDVTITINDDGAFVNDAQITVVDIATDNGVVHVIDAVLVPPTTTVVDVIVNSEDHNTLEAAVVAAGLVETLNGEGPFTVFAPTDSAFSALPEGLIDTLLADPTGDLTDILLYHVISGDIRSTDLMDGQMVATINGKDVTITINEDGAFVNDAQITVVDIATDNGVVHVIDAVLTPPTTVVDVIANSENHNTLEAAITAAGLDGTLNSSGPFTVFAPTDSAFSVLPEGLIDTLLADPTGDLTDILLYHVINGDIRSTDLMDGQMVATINGKEVSITINGEGAFVNDARITAVDIVTDNGVVHVIDAVLVPPARTVVDIIVNSEDHNTLEAAVVAAGLVETLNGEGPFTVFAPTDAAFSALPEGLVDTLLADPTGDLTDILLYHVISGDVRSTTLMDGQMVTTINGADVTITINENGAFVNDAQITVVDIVADNGVVHVIDAVLVPDASTSVEVIGQTTSEVRIFPNPATNEFAISTQLKMNQAGIVSLYDVQGRIIRVYNANATRFSLDGISSGMYYIKTVIEEKTYIGKLIVND